MRLAYKVWSGIAAVTFSSVALVDLSGGAATTTPAVPASSSGTLTGTSAGTVATAPAAAEDMSVVASGVSVIDGDTFRTADGQRVRVLGIDSCEAATPGGARATAQAHQLLDGATVTLTAQPGVDRDRYGRLLRYVSANGRDYAEQMVVADHTAIYTGGRNDASAAVQARLAALDTDGRTCGDTVVPTTSSAAPSPRPAVDVDRPTTRRPAAPSVAAPAPARAAAPAASSGGAAYYANCTAARAAGVTPLHRGQAGYSAKLDRDGDGIACE